MTRRSRFVAGTVGQPGERTLLPAGQRGRPGDQRRRWRSSRSACSPSASTSCSTRCCGAPAGRRRPGGRPGGAGRRRPARPAADRGLPGRRDRAGLGRRGRAGGHRGAGGDRERRSSRWPRTCPRTGPGCCGCGSPPAQARAFSQRALQIVAQGRPAVPAVRAAAGRGGAHLPAAERPPGRRCLNRPAGEARAAAGPPARPARPAPRRRGRPAGQSPPATGPARWTTGPRSSCSPRATWRSRDGWSTPPTPRCTAASAHGDQAAACVYKPVAGERPLWDFPTGHAGRPGGGRLRGVPGRGLGHRAAHRVAGRPVRARHVPAVDRRRRRPTCRPGAARRPPSCATWPSSTRWSTTPTARSAICCPCPAATLYGCDHGVCFGEEYKLRTVLWQWRGRSLPGRAMRRWPAAGRAGRAATLADELAALAAPRRRSRPPGTGSTCCSSTGCIPTRRRTGPPSPGRRCRRVSWPDSRRRALAAGCGADQRPPRLPGRGAAQVTLELPGDRVPARLGQIGRVLGLLQRAHVVRDLGVLLGELVHAALPGPGLLGQVGQRQRDVQDVLDAAEQGQRGLRAGRLGHVVRHGGPQRHRRDARLGARVLEHADDPGRALVVHRLDVQLARPAPGPTAAAVTGTGRVCGESASSAPSSTTISTPSSVKDSTSSSQNARQRMLGSIPCTSTMSRSAASGWPRTAAWSARPGARSGPSDTSMTGRVTWKS